MWRMFYFLLTLSGDLCLVLSPASFFTASPASTSASLWTNYRSVFRSRDQYGPIRGQYSGHVIIIIQSQASIQVTWSVWANHKSVFRSRDQYCPITGQYLGHVISFVQSELSITWQGGCGASRAGPRGHSSDKALALTQSRAAAWPGPEDMSS